MKINTKTQLKTVGGEPFMDAEKKPITLGSLIANTLTMMKSPDPLKSYLLTNEFYNKDEADVTTQDIVFVKDILKKSVAETGPNGTYQNPYAIGQAMELLENGGTPVSEEAGASIDKDAKKKA
jgi:hypothetical protein